MEGGLVWIPIIGSAGFYAMVAFIVYAVTKSKQRRAQLQAEVQTKLIERFGTASEFIEFLQSPPGRQFMTGFEGQPKAAVRDRILGGVTKSIVLSFLGLGFLATCLWDEVRNEGFVIAGCLLLALGIGFFLSTIVSIKLSKSWGLLNGANTTTPSSSTL